MRHMYISYKSCPS